MGPEQASLAAMITVNMAAIWKPPVDSEHSEWHCRRLSQSAWHDGQCEHRGVDRIHAFCRAS